MRSLFLFLLSVSVVIVVSCGGSAQAPDSGGLLVTPEVVDFGSSSSRQSIQLQNKNSSPYSWSMTSNKPWLSVSPAQGTIGSVPQFVMASIDRSMNLSDYRTAAITFIATQNIPAQNNKQNEQQSGKNIPVKLVVVNVVPGSSVLPVENDPDVVTNEKKTNHLLPVNLTKPDFVENGARETHSKIVMLKVSAEDQRGIAAYAVFDIASPVIQAGTEVDALLQNWVEVPFGNKFNAVLTYNFINDYQSGESVVVGVVFKNMDGGVSSVAQDSIIYMSEDVRESVSPELEGHRVLQQEPVVLPYSGSSGGRGENSSGGVISMAGPGSVQSQSDNVQQQGGAQIIYSYNFEQGYSGWWVDNGQWQIGSVPVGRSYRCSEGRKCAGTVLLSDYVDYVESRLVSPAIFLTAPGNDQRILLTFVNWYAVHLHDLVRLQISEQTSPGQWSRWKTLMTHSGSSRKWKLEMMGVTNYAGKTVRFAFDLYQAPGQAGVKQGWYVDDFKVMIRP